MTQNDDSHRAELLHRSVTLRTWSEVLMVRSQLACRTAAEHQRRTVPPWVYPASPAIEPVAVSEIFTILVDHHGMDVLEAVRWLTVHLAASGYPEDTDFVSAADGVEITHAILAAR